MENGLIFHVTIQQVIKFRSEVSFKPVVLRLLPGKKVHNKGWVAKPLDQSTARDSAELLLIGGAREVIPLTSLRPEISHWSLCGGNDILL